eukprot:364885-Chlamydomonas_euryale.AAC.4
MAPHQGDARQPHTLGSLPQQPHAVANRLTMWCRAHAGQVWRQVAYKAQHAIGVRAERLGQRRCMQAVALLGGR